MNPSCKASCRRASALKPIALAVALALPHATSWAASIKDVILTRADQDIGARYGRDSLYAVTRHPDRVKLAQSPARSGGLFSRAKSYNAAPVGKALSSVTHDSAQSIDVLLANRPQSYGRAGGYIGWERVVVMQPVPTIATSTFPGRYVVKNGTGHENNVPDLRTGDEIYRRELAAWSVKGANTGSPATQEGEEHSVAVANAIPEANEQPASASLVLGESNPLHSDDPLAGPVQPARDLITMKTLGEGQDDPSTQARREPASFRSEDDNSATIRGESAGTRVTDDASGAPIDPVVRALPEQAPLPPDEESYFDVEEHRSAPVEVESSLAATVTDNASLDEADAATGIVAPLPATSDSEADNPAAAKLDEELASRREPPVEDLPEAKITVTVVDKESPMDGIRMSKRVK
jgi:hypothetical protein